MPKIKRTTGPDGKENGYMFFCPGCKAEHIFNVDNTSHWEFNNDFEKPTLKPSYKRGFNNFTKNLCHSHITNGKIQFCADSFHSLRHQTVDLPDFPEDKDAD